MGIQRQRVCPPQVCIEPKSEFVHVMASLEWTGLLAPISRVAGAVKTAGLYGVVINQRPAANGKKSAGEGTS